jgi:hypothetical protein
MLYSLNGEKIVKYPVEENYHVLLSQLLEHGQFLRKTEFYWEIIRTPKLLHIIEWFRD